MEQKDISINTSARYFTLGSITEETKKIWIVLHGYGQLASYFIQNFKVLENHETFVIAPEGLSRFYLQGFSGRVGATWMTKEDRLRDINNNLEYLNAIYKLEVEPHLNPKIEIVLLGFSQGCATLLRWAVQEHIYFNKLILWAGSIPPDLDLDQAIPKLKEKIVYIVYGEQDPFLQDEAVVKMMKLIDLLNISPQIVTFTGAHNLDGPTLQRIS